MARHWGEAGTWTMERRKSMQGHSGRSLSAIPAQWLTLRVPTRSCETMRLWDCETDSHPVLEAVSLYRQKGNLIVEFQATHVHQGLALAVCSIVLHPFEMIPVAYICLYREGVIRSHHQHRTEPYLPEAYLQGEHRFSPSRNQLATGNQPKGKNRKHAQKSHQALPLCPHMGFLLFLGPCSCYPSSLVWPFKLRHLLQKAHLSTNSHSLPVNIY